MFKWFQQRKQDQAKLTRAYDVGQRIVQQFEGELEAQIDRYELVFDEFIVMLQTELNRCLLPGKVPTLIDANIRFHVFLENIDKLHDKMVEDLTSALSSWFEIDNDFSEEFDRVIRLKAQDFRKGLVETGLERFTEMQYALQIADDEWRAENPDLPARYPRKTER